MKSKNANRHIDEGAYFEAKAAELLKDHPELEGGGILLKETRPLYMVKGAKGELADTKDGEEGFVLVYFPVGDDKAYILTKLEIPGFSFGDGDLRFFVKNPDIRIVPYKNVNNDDELYIFAVAIDMNIITAGFIDSYVTIKNRKPVYIQITKDHGYQANEVPTPEVANHILLLHESRIREIFSDLHKLRITAKD
jgi:hypothetical protein